MIYITNYSSGLDLSAIKMFTDERPIYITKDKVDPFKTKDLLERIRSTIQEMTENDWLLLVGNIAVTSLCVIEAARHLKEVNLLIWDARTRTYVNRTV